MASLRPKLDPANGPEDRSFPGISGSVHQGLSLFPWPLISIMAAAFLVVLPWFYQGVPSGHDFEFHLNSWMEVLSQWKQGILYPRWAAMANQGFGEPRFVFYPPASWILGAALGAILPWNVVPGVYVWIVLTLSGCSMFFLARSWLGRQDAIFAAALYAANPYHLVIAYWRSAFAEMLAAVLLPLLVMLVSRSTEKGRAVVVPLGLLVAAAWLTNLPSAVMLNYSMALMLVVLAVTRRSPRVLMQGGAAAAFGAALAAFYLVPAIGEQKWVDIASVVAPGVRPQDNFLFTMIADPRHNRFNLLVSMVAVAELIAVGGAVWLSWRRRRDFRPLWGMLVVWTAAIALLLFPFTRFAWEHFPKLRFMQLPWRWLLCLNASFALLFAMAWRRWVPRVLICVALLMVLASAWLLVQPPWWEKSVDFANMAAQLQDGRGYEGTDEYLPNDGDAYEVKPDAPMVRMEDNGRARIQMQKWSAEEKSFTADVSQSSNLVLRLFSYPAWQAEVNGQVVETDDQDYTGQLLIPVDAGENRVRVRFTHTRDRIIGDVISGITALLMLALLLWQRRQGLLLRQNLKDSLAAS